MPDILDDAKELEMRHRDSAISEFLANRSEPEQYVVDGQVLCIRCHSVIEPARLNAKPEAARCIRCQHAEEAHGRYR